MTGAIPSRVCLPNGLWVATSGVPGAGAGTEGRDEEEGRGMGVGIRGAGADGFAAATGLDAGRGGTDDARGAGTEACASSAGNGAAAGISSAPHSASMSSVGGAIDGTGGLELTRSLGLSVIALSWPFHGGAHKSSSSIAAGLKDRQWPQQERTFPVFS